jgi:hypothetical protein
MLRRLFTRPPAVVFTATGLTRTLTVTDDAFVTIRVRGGAWWAMSEHRKDGRDREVTFPLVAIRGGSYRTATWYRPGALVLNVPQAGDPWRRRTQRQRAKATFPKTRPHTIRFTAHQQPAFAQCAHQIGLADNTAR